MIYADNAATTKLDKDALAAMLPWLQDNLGMLRSHILSRGNPKTLWQMPGL